MQISPKASWKLARSVTSLQLFTPSCRPRGICQQTQQSTNEVPTNTCDNKLKYVIACTIQAYLLGEFYDWNKETTVEVTSISHPSVVYWRSAGSQLGVAYRCASCVQRSAVNVYPATPLVPPQRRRKKKIQINPTSPNVSREYSFSRG